MEQSRPMMPHALELRVRHQALRSRAVAVTHEALTTPLACNARALERRLR